MYTSSTDQQLDQPPILLVNEQGQHHIVVWPDGNMKYFKFAGGMKNPTVEFPETGINNFSPFQGGSINTDGDILVAMLMYGVPEQLFMFYDAGNRTWNKGSAVAFETRSESPTGSDRHTFPFVVLNGREAHIFSTQDIEDPIKIAEGASYTFSYHKLDYYYSPDVVNAPFQTVNVVNIEGTRGWVHNDDMLLDGAGQIHLLYWYQTEERNWQTIHHKCTPLAHLEGL